MKHGWRYISMFFSIIFFCFMMSACSGDAPWRYSPEAPDKPVGLVATAGNGQVALSWPAAGNAAAYNIYYSTTPGVSRDNGIKVANVVSTSYIQTGLINDTTYYFVVTSVNSSGESSESSQMSVTPAMLGSYAQGDLEGTWNFNILVSGTGAGWMRGELKVDNSGTVTYSSFLDNSGNSVPPANLFPVLLLSSNGQVRDGGANPATFQGVMAASRKMIVGNSSQLGTSQTMAILQKRVPGVTFSNAGDIQGFGNAGGGGRRFIYNQIASGSGQEWEFAAGQIGKDQKIQYTTLTAPSNPAMPGDKASMMNITADGVVTESRTAALPQPAAVIDRGVMSADKSVVIGVATDTTGAGPKFILRIYQLVNITPNDPNTFTMTDMIGTYNLRKLLGGSSPLSASGTIMMNASGTIVFSSYADSNGVTALPADFSPVVDSDGSLNSNVDPSLRGKLSYFKDMFVVTRTDSPGDYSLSIALKR